MDLGGSTALAQRSEGEGRRWDGGSDLWGRARNGNEEDAPALFRFRWYGRARDGIRVNRGNRRASCASRGWAADPRARMEGRLGGRPAPADGREDEIFSPLHYF
jgi:hypothetical protein